MAGVNRRVIFNPDVAPPGGPYSQALIVGNQMYLSGQIGRDVNGVIAEGIEAQAHQCLKNIEKVVKTAGQGMNLGNVVKMTVLLRDISDWPVVNEVYKKYFNAPYPARAAYAVKDLPMGALIEIEGEAIVGKINDL